MKLSNFGIKMSTDAGILQLMDDLGRALAGAKPEAMLGGGNPAQIEAVQEAFRDSLQTIINDPTRLAMMLGNYDTPQGNATFITTIKDFLNRHYQLGISEDNIAITPGSQAGFFMLFNMLAGRTGDDARKVLFPLVPEYIGYVDQLVEPDSLVSQEPRIELIGEHEFKYHVDFDRLSIDDTIAAMCVSRPTNPSGNVVSDDELRRLAEVAQANDIPLIIDNAYGLPFPGVIKPDVSMVWNSHTVLSMSLSKVGLPSSRVGIFVGPPDLMKALTSANAILNLASPSIGQYIMQPLIESDEILRLCSEHIKPYYFERAERARHLMMEQFPPDLPWRLHQHEGSYFFWLWCSGAKLSGKQMYEQLKQVGVIVVPGEYFFPGKDENIWPHAHECLRLNFARSDDELEKGVIALKSVIEAAYRG